MESGRVSGLASRQDGTQFEDALRRLHALEKKLTDQVQIDIRELRSKWILPRVERVTTNTFKLYQVREQLKLSKVLYLEEERILEEFNKVKQGLKTSSMDDEEFEATRETCMFLGGKLMDIRSKQLKCYSENEDMEITINKDIMALRFEDKDFDDLDLNQVRASTPLRQLSPTPLDRHRSREPSPFKMPKLRLGSGTITPGGSRPTDPHTYLSRPGSSQSLYGGIGGSHLDLDTFRAAMEAKQAEDESLSKDREQSSNHLPTLSQSMCNINLKSGSSLATKPEGMDFLTPGSMFSAERPSSAMSEMSINIHEGEYMSRAESRMEHFGDDVSDDIIIFGHGHDFTDTSNAPEYLFKGNKEKNQNTEVITFKTLPEKQMDTYEPNQKIEKIEVGNETLMNVKTIKIQASMNEPEEKVEIKQVEHELKITQESEHFEIKETNLTTKQERIAKSTEKEKEEIIKKKVIKTPNSTKKTKLQSENMEGKDRKDGNPINKDSSAFQKDKFSPDAKTLRKDIADIEKELQIENGSQPELQLKIGSSLDDNFETIGVITADISKDLALEQSTKESNYARDTKECEIDNKEGQSKKGNKHDSKMSKEKKAPFSRKEEVTKDNDNEQEPFKTGINNSKPTPPDTFGTKQRVVEYDVSAKNVEKVETNASNEKVEINQLEPKTFVLQTKETTAKEISSIENLTKNVDAEKQKPSESESHMASSKSIHKEEFSENDQTQKAKASIETDNLNTSEHGTQKTIVGDFQHSQDDQEPTRSVDTEEVLSQKSRPKGRSVNISNADELKKLESEMVPVLKSTDIEDLSEFQDLEKNKTEMQEPVPRSKSELVSDETRNKNTEKDQTQNPRITECSENNQITQPKQQSSTDNTDQIQTTKLHITNQSEIKGNAKNETQKQSIESSEDKQILSELEVDKINVTQKCRPGSAEIEAEKDQKQRSRPSSRTDKQKKAKADIERDLSQESKSESKTKTMEELEPKSDEMETTEILQSTNRFKGMDNSATEKEQKERSRPSSRTDKQNKSESSDMDQSEESKSESRTETIRTGKPQEIITENKTGSTKNLEPQSYEIGQTEILNSMETDQKEMSRPSSGTDKQLKLDQSQELKPEGRTETIKQLDPKSRETEEAEITQSIKSRKISVTSESGGTGIGQNQQLRPTSRVENLDQQFLIDDKDLELCQIQKSRTPSRPTSRQESQLNSRKPKTETLEERPVSRGSLSGFTQTEPAEWYQPDDNEFDNEDELMIILDAEHIALEEEEEPEVNPLGLLNSRSASRERSNSRNSQGSTSNSQLSAASEVHEIPAIINQNIQVLRKMDMEIEMDVETNDDLEALKELEIQYEKDNGNDSRSSYLGTDLARTSSMSDHSGRKTGTQESSPISFLAGDNKSRDVSQDRTENVNSKELISRPGSRSSLKSSNKRNSIAEKKKISFDDDIEIKDLSDLSKMGEKLSQVDITLLDTGDFPQSEPADWYPSDNEDELFIVLDADNQLTDEDVTTDHIMFLNKNRSQSIDRKKSTSIVPELEVVEMPHSLRRKMEDLESDVDYLKGAHDNFTKIQCDGHDHHHQEDSITKDFECDIASDKKTHGQYKTIQSDGFEQSIHFDRADSPRPQSQNRPPSTGFIHLDDFERKLAEMESELADEEIKRQELDMNEKEEHSLSRGENMWDLSSNIERTSEFEQFALDFEEGIEYQKDSKFASVRKNDIAQQNLTDDGFYINQEEELHTVDHSMIKGGEYTTESGDVGSGCVSPGQSDARSKKVSFAASDERYEIERPGEVNTLGNKLFSFSPPKPMKKLPGKEIQKEETTNISQELKSIEVPILVTKKSTSKEPSPMLSDKTSSAKGLLSSITGKLGSKSPDPNRKDSGSLFGSLLRKGRKGSRSGSRQSSVERSSQDLGSEEEGRTPSRTSDVGSDAGSENSLVMKLKKLTKRKPPKVKTADFDELFARGMAKSAQLDSENNKDPFTTNGREPVVAANFTPFELYSKDSEFQKTQKQEGIGYAEKVMCFLDDQAHTPQIIKDITDEPEMSTRGRNKGKQCRKEAKQVSDSSKNEENKSEQYATQDEIKLSPIEHKKDMFPGKDIPKSPGEESPMLNDKTSSTKNLLSSITGGRIGSKSPDPNRKDNGSLFGSLLRKGRKGSRSGSRQSSVERSSQDLGSEEEGRTPSRTSDVGSDAGSENSLVMKLKKLTKIKPPKVKTADFDELFARGMAKSAQLESDNNRAPFKTNGRSPVDKANFTPFELYSKDTEFQKTPKEESIGYAEKVMSFLDDQAHTPQMIKDITGDQETLTRGRNQGKQSNKEEKQVSDSNQNENVRDKENKSKQYATLDEIKLSPIEPMKHMFTGKDLPKSPEEEFLAKITQFVSKYEVDSQYTQQVWPAIPSQDKLPPLRDSKSSPSKLLEGAPVQLTKSPQEMFDKFTQKQNETKPTAVRSTSRSTVVSTTDPQDSQLKGEKPNNILEPKVQTFNTVTDMSTLSDSQCNQDGDEVMPVTSRIDQSSENNKDETFNTMSEADFLAKVTSFVAKYDPAEEYAQKIWRAKPPQEDQILAKESKSGTKAASHLAKTHGKTYLDIESGTEWFGASIEMENTKTDVIRNKTKKSSDNIMKSGNNLSTGAALMRTHISATDRAKSTTPKIEETKDANQLTEASAIDENTENKWTTPKIEDTQESCNIENDDKRTKTLEIIISAPSVKQLESSEPPKSIINRDYPSLQLSPVVPICEPSPRKDEPIDEGILLQLEPEKGTANEQFYSKLVAGLRSITTPDPEHTKETAEPDIYRKYSHHLGRAEFGSLRKKDSTQSSSSNLRYHSRDSVYNLPSRGLSRDPSFDKINVKLATSRKVSRQDSGDQMRSQSKVSDTSEFLPDLELDDDLPPVLFSNKEVSRPVRTHSSTEGKAVSKHVDTEQSGISTGDQVEIKEQIQASTEVFTKKEEALKDVADHKQKIKEVKAQIQNGLMTVVGFGVMAYLTTLETMGGGQ